MSLFSVVVAMKRVAVVVRFHSGGQARGLWGEPRQRARAKKRKRKRKKLPMFDWFYAYLDDHRAKIEKAKRQ